MATNNAYRKRFLSLTGAAVDNTEATILTEVDSDAGPGPYGYLHLSARSEAAVTIRVYWGGATGVYESVSTYEVPASASDGGGIGDVVRIPARYFKITAQRNGAVSSAAFRCFIDLSAY